MRLALCMQISEKGLFQTVTAAGSFMSALKKKREGASDGGRLVYIANRTHHENGQGLPLVE